MSEVLGALYHWAPVDRRVGILQQGLVPYANAVCHGEVEGRSLSYPYVCLGLTPSGAWGLSGGSDSDVQGEYDWDLWQVRLADSDHVDVLSTWGAVLREVRVRNAITADRVWWVATRAGLAAREVA